MLVSCSAYTSTLKMEAICSSETSDDFQRTKRRYTSEDKTVYITTGVRTENPATLNQFHAFLWHSALSGADFKNTGAILLCSIVVCLIK
jgi:hypothetical protein